MCIQESAVRLHVGGSPHNPLFTTDAGGHERRERINIFVLLSLLTKPLLTDVFDRFVTGRKIC